MSNTTPTETRQFTFAEGTSNKFWNITLDGLTHTVQYGRVGTVGQAQEKAFDSDEEARVSYTKLIAEKVKKGYVESVASGEDGATTIAVTTTTATPKVAKVATAKAITEPLSPKGIDENPPKIIRLAERDYEKVCQLDPQSHKPRPAMRPFDKEKCLQILEGMQKEYKQHSTWKWDKAKIDLGISKQEAHFWLEVTRIGYYFNNEVERKSFTITNFDGSISFNIAVECISKYYVTNSDLINALFILFGVDGIAKYIAQSPTTYGSSYYITMRMKEFYDNIFIYLDESEREKFRELLINTSVPDLWMIEGFSRLGMQAELRKIIATWTGQGKWQAHYYANQSFRHILCISDPDLVVAELRRLTVGPSNQEEVRALFARTETRGLDIIASMALVATSKAEAEGVMRGLCLVEMPEAAPYILECATNSKAVAIAREWLSTHIVHAIDGLLPMATKTGKQADAALDYFRNLKKQGHGELIARRLAGQSEEIVKAVTEKVLSGRRFPIQR
jgi:predicted DNA-binding WGR domain protein